MVGDDVITDGAFDGSVYWNMCNVPLHILYELRDLFTKLGVRYGQAGSA